MHTMLSNSIVRVIHHTCK